MKGMFQSIRALMRLKPSQKLTRQYLVSLFIAVSLALLVGAAAVSVGAGMIYLPAGVIAAGLLLMVGAVLGGGGDA